LGTAERKVTIGSDRVLTTSFRPFIEAPLPGHLPQIRVPDRQLSTAILGETRRSVSVDNYTGEDLRFNRFVASTIAGIATRPGRPLPGQDSHLLDQRTFSRRTWTTSPVRSIPSTWGATWIGRSGPETGEAVVVPAADHLMWEAKSGSMFEIASLNGFVPDYRRILLDWLSRRFRLSQ